jgi:TonB family protein
VSKEKTAFVLLYAKQRIQLDASQPVVSYSPPSSPEVDSAETTGGIVGGAKEDADRPVRVIGTMKTPRLLKKVEPVYSKDARKAGVQGTIIVQVTTDNQGNVVDAKVIKSTPLLDSAVIDAVRQWVYEPMIIEGKPRRAILIVTFQCDLSKKP